jgi:hypothetical protein
MRQWWPSRRLEIEDATGMYFDRAVEMAWEIWGVTPAARALASEDAQDAAPAEYVIVPREPTSGMVKAGQAAGWQAEEGQAVQASYKAMIAARPAPSNTTSAEPVAWAIVDSNGVPTELMYGPPKLGNRCDYWDGQWPKLAPHRVAPLYAHPSPPTRNDESEFPPLPEPYWSSCRYTNFQDVFTAYQMRAYVLADRAALKGGK